MSAYKKALDLKPESIPWRTDYGLFLARNGNSTRAWPSSRRWWPRPATRTRPAGSTSAGSTATCKPPKVEESIAAYKKALELDPKEEQAALGLGWAYLTSQEYDEAIAAYNQAMQIDPKRRRDANIGIAWCHFFKKDMDQALAFADKAKEAGRPVSRPRRAGGALQEGDGRGRRGRGRGGEGLRGGQEGQGRGRRGSTRSTRTCAARTPAPACARRATSPASGGPDAVATLIWMQSNDKDWGVKQVVAASLGNMGAAAKPALALPQACSNPCSDTIVMSKEEMAENMLCEDARRVCQQAVAKIPK